MQWPTAEAWPAAASEVLATDFGDEPEGDGREYDDGREFHDGTPQQCSFSKGAHRATPGYAPMTPRGQLSARCDDAKMHEVP